MTSDTANGPLTDTRGPNVDRINRLIAAYVSAEDQLVAMMRDQMGPRTGQMARAYITALHRSRLEPGDLIPMEVDS